MEAQVKTEERLTHRQYCAICNICFLLMLLTEKEGETMRGKQEQERRKGDACEVQGRRQIKSLPCLMSLTRAHTHRLSDSASAHTEHTLPESILVSVYSCAIDQITCDTNMKSEEVPSFSLYPPSPFPRSFFPFQCSTRSCRASWLYRHEKHASLISYVKLRTSNLGSGVELESKWQQQELKPTACYTRQPQTNKSVGLSHACKHLWKLNTKTQSKCEIIRVKLKAEVGVL